MCQVPGVRRVQLGASEVSVMDLCCVVCRAVAVVVARYVRKSEELQWHQQSRGWMAVAVSNWISVAGTEFPPKSQQFE